MRFKYLSFGVCTRTLKRKIQHFSDKSQSQVEKYAENANKRMNEIGFFHNVKFNSAGI